MRWIWIVALLLGSAGATASEMWRWVDERGVVHYSDRPRPGAERVDIRSIQSYEAPELPARPERLATQDEAAASPYTRIAIESPANGETLWNIGGELSVSLAVEPPLLGEHTLRLYLDGQQVGGVPQGPQQFTIGNVFRGERSLRASIVDAQGRELAESATVVFYVHQTSTLNPASPSRPGRPGGGG
jgi:hypothetical protein